MQLLLERVFFQFHNELIKNVALPPPCPKTEITQTILQRFENIETLEISARDLLEETVVMWYLI